MEDYWDGYSEYDSYAEELKATLINSVKADVKAKIEKLERENAELREKQANLSKLETEATTKLRLAEQREKDAERNGLRLKAAELLKALERPAYNVRADFVKRDKCGNCNDDRQYDFTYPSGKPGKEDCECKRSKRVYVVKEAVGTEARVTFWGGKRELIIWYEAYSDDEMDSIKGKWTTVYNGEDFSKIGTSYTFYDSEVAQKYADYLNEKDAA